ncbi:ABC-three component system protein [Cellulomonas sp. P24]|uniref:ABC-three component system protein n=1 Tax=Cellulomonas sp. P24 TaxID=2885206 RepID=UPI00216B2CD5|nr:ABC-three component system protein [Cellulomonas sp. P24]MCR6491445.1 hypothetical protein [Cellulomonas sp. P24]
MTKHSAAGSALGYQYQADYCLLAFLRDSGPGRSISLELHDDFAWDDGNVPTDLVQVKHRVTGAGGLGDRSDALWRTLKVWMDEANPADPDGARLCLVTTGTAAPGSAAAYLQVPVNVDAALTALRAAAIDDATGEGTAPGRSQFRKLSPTVQRAFVSRIQVVDAQPTIVDIEAAIRNIEHRHMPADAQKQDEYIDQLFGWWRRRVVEMLSHRYFPNRGLRATVTSSDLQFQENRLAVAFSNNGLPEYDDLDIEDDDDALAGLDNEVFVHQMQILKIDQMLLRQAIVDYYRATTSETRWLDRDFLERDDVRKYERRLKDRWRSSFGMMCTRMPENPTASQRVEAGRTLLQEVLYGAPVPIRTQVDQDFYYRGKHHMLAQAGEIGWHPEFESRLGALLVGQADG